MDRINPFTCDVSDKNLDWVGRITDPVSISGSVRFNGMGNFEFRLKATDPMLEDILAPGARVSMAYRGAPLMSGMVRLRQGSLIPGGDVIFQLQDDWRMLANTIAMVRPEGAISMSINPGETYPDFTIDPRAQANFVGDSNIAYDGTVNGQYGFFKWPNGSTAFNGLDVTTSEGAIKHLIELNLLDRLGRPVTIATNQQRGGSIKRDGKLPNIRMAKVLEGVEPILAYSGLGLRLVQEGRSSTVGVEVYEPTTWGATITVASGVITAGDWSLTPPTATRSIIGGPGEGAARAFWDGRAVLPGDDIWYPRPATSALENEYGDIIEVFKDATSIKLNWPSTLADQYRVAKYYSSSTAVVPDDRLAFLYALHDVALKGLADGVATSGVTATLSETPTFSFGGTDGIQLGDTLTVENEGGLVFSERVTEAKFSLTKKSFKVEPILGTKTDDPNRSLAESIASVAATQRRLSASK